MWPLIIIVVSAAGLLFGFASCGSASTKVNQPDDTTGQDQQIPQDSIKPIYTRAEIITMLEHLNEIPVPDTLEMGAMCYAKPHYPDSAVYVCPKCGERTVYHNYYGKYVEDVVYASRQMMKILPENFSLDESACCRACTPSSTEPEICLVASYPDSKEKNSTCGIYDNDLDMLVQFLKQRPVYMEENGEEVPLIKKEERLRELLGIKTH